MATTDYQALLKTIFGDPIDPIPSEGTLAADIKFVPAEKSTGDKYRRPVSLQHEQGFTYNADHEAFTLLDEVSGVEDYAELEGAEFAGVAQMSTGLMHKMSRAKGDSRKAYDQAMARKIGKLMLSAENRREIALMYGPGSSGLANLGVVSTVHTETGTTLVVSLTRGSYSPGLWKQLIGAKFDFHSSGGALHNDLAACQLTGINTTNHRLTFLCDATDISNGEIAANDVITFHGSRVKSAVGLQAIADNTGALFGIDGATQPCWRVEQYSVGGPLTFDKVVEGLAGANENGLDYGVNLYLGGRAWTDLMTDEAALRRHVKSGEVSKKEGVGYKELEFMSLCGPIKIKTHRFMKQGIAWAVPVQQCERVGSTDLTFSAPGSKNEWFFRELETKMGCQIRCYSDQALLVSIPYHMVQYTGIASTSDVVPA